MSKSTPVQQLTYITLDSVKVNEKQNARETYDEDKIQELAKSINTRGLIQPIVVREGEKENSYELVAGYRRLRAMRLLGWKGCECVVMQLSSLEQRLVNLAENAARDALTSYELARGLSLAKEHSKVEGKELSNKNLAEQIGKSESHCGNLIRAARTLHPKILAAWAEKLPLATDMNIFSLAKIKDQNKQWEGWLALHPEYEEKDKEKNEEKNSSDNEEKSMAGKIRRKKDITEALEELEAHRKTNAVKAMISTLNWVLQYEDEPW